MKSLIFLSFLVISTVSNAQSEYLTEIKNKWKNAEAYTLEVAKLMPESQYQFRPSPEEMTFAGQLLHIAKNMHWLSTSYLNGTKTTKDLEGKDYSKAQIIEILEETFRIAAEALEKIPVAALEEKVDFFAGPMSKRQIINLMNDHLTHHRGQLIVYLRLNGIKPPSYRGW